jgi:hypothetical protein
MLGILWVENCIRNKYPEKVDKLVVADGTKYYAPHHDEIFAGLNAVDFSTNLAALKWKKHCFVPLERVSFNEKFVLEEPTQLAFPI